MPIEPAPTVRGIEGSIAEVQLMHMEVSRASASPRRNDWRGALAVNLDCRHFLCICRALTPCAATTQLAGLRFGLRFEFRQYASKPDLVRDDNHRCAAKPAISHPDDPLLTDLRAQLLERLDAFEAI